MHGFTSILPRLFKLAACLGLACALQGSSALSQTNTATADATTNGRVVFTAYDVKLNFEAGDVGGGANTGVSVGRFSGGMWRTPTIWARMFRSAQATNAAARSNNFARIHSIDREERSMMKSPRTLDTDDREGFRRPPLSSLRVQRGVEIIGEAADGIEAVDRTEKLQPDLVLIDSDMPNQDGFRAARQIKLRSPETRVVVLSMHDGDIYRWMAVEYQADGFIDKGSMKHALLALLASEQARVGGVAAVGIHAA